MVYDSDLLKKNMETIARVFDYRPNLLVEDAMHAQVRPKHFKFTN